MGRNSSIEWTHHTFNPWWGCTKVSAACSNCYAEAWARRVGRRVWGKNAERRFLGEAYWREPLKWHKQASLSQIRQRVFCASMADVFEDRRDLDAWRRKLWDLIESTPSLDWLLLTKRPEKVRALQPWGSNWPSNVWLGTTVESQRWVDSRIGALVENPAAIHFLSCEPLLSPLDLGDWLHCVDWIIVGGESGPRARPMNPAWLRALRDAATSSGVAFHFKQWGDWLPADLQHTDTTLSSHSSAVRFERVGKKIAGRTLDGRTWDEVPLPPPIRREVGR